MTRLAVSTVAGLQLVDLATTWVGIHLPGLHEVDGLNFWALVLIKLTMTAVILLASWPRPRLIYAATVLLALGYVPVVLHNLELISLAWR